MTVLPASKTAADIDASSTLWQLRAVSVGKRLQSVTLRINCGVTAILGASGSGKSTLIDVLSGEIKPTEGTIERLDMRAIGATPQNSAADDFVSDGGVSMLWAGSGEGLWPQMTVADQILSVGGDPQEWLPRFDLNERRNAKPSVLSQGERSRCELARALAAQPRTLLLDEPLTHVDRRRAAFGWDAIAEWAQIEGHHLILATHDLAAARRLANDVVCLDRGRVIDAGPLKTVAASPRCDESVWILGGESA